MKKTKRTYPKSSKRTSNQAGSTKNWTTALLNSRKQRLTAVFVLGIALLGSYLVITSLASARPRYWGNTDYWMGRIRACESAQGVWQKDRYTVGVNAYGYSPAEWNNYAGVADASEALPKDQDAKFIADWNNPNIGSKPWEDTIECWKPGGTIAGAPCLPIPLNPLNTDTATTQNTDVNTNDSSDSSENPATTDDPDTVDTENDNPDESE